jgi:hypothetical protein
MNKIEVLSARGWNEYKPLQVVYEWEDIIAECCGIRVDADSMVKMNQLFDSTFNFQAQRVIRNTFLHRFIDNSFNYLHRTRPGTHFLNFVLYPHPIRNFYSYSANVIPILLDCFADSIDKVPEYFRLNKIVFVTNIEVFDYLARTSIGGKLRYIPLSISDRYFSAHVPKKEIDLLQVGRQNPILHQWAIEFTMRHPEFEYVYGGFNGKIAEYLSTRRGSLGLVDSREDFMKLMASARISLVSSPGIDGGEKRTGGFNPVTPRFYESLAAQCFMVGRYNDTPDFVHNQVSEVCARPENFASFEKLVLEMLQRPFEINETSSQFLKRHLTSTVALSIKRELETLQLF